MATAPRRSRDEFVASIEKRLGAVLERRGFADWWETSIPALDGFTPREMLDGGNWSALDAIVDGYREQGFS